MAGPIFFRWPNRSETLAFAPDDVQRIVSGEGLSTATTLRVGPATCIERQCSDLYLDMASSVNSADQIIRVSIKGPLEIFIPGRQLKPHLADGRYIDFNIPAYAGSGQVYLGRAISHSLLQFETRTP